jgi:two-component system chemotaxis response regulator CheB
MTSQSKIKVLIVDDSSTARNLLKLLLSEDPQFEIIGIVSNGREAVEFAEKEKPDVISMDIHMPEMNGFEATREIMENNPVPIVIVSTAYNPNETQLSFKALEAGALKIMPRPFGPGHPDFLKHGKSYRSILKSLSEVKVIKRHRSNLAHSEVRQQEQKNLAQPNKELYRDTCGVVAIGSSAGGPSALQVILNTIKQDFPAPILIVQHIEKGFAEGFAHWLGTVTQIPVCIPKNGETLMPGCAYLPSGDHHLGVSKEGIAFISSAPAENGLRPSVSFLFRSVGTHYGKRAVAIMLSGMGRDGAEELKYMKDMGAYTIVQDEESALVYGMPGEAIRLNAFCRILPPERMARAITEQVNSFKKH